MPTLAALGFVGLTMSCGGDSPVEPPAQRDETLLQTVAANKGDVPKLNDDAFTIHDMLGDPLFQALVQSIKEPSLSEPLLAAMEALESGQVRKAARLIARTGAEARALQSDSGAHAEELILWSAIEQFLDIAVLI